MSILATGHAYKIIAEAAALKVKWRGKASSVAADFTSQMSEVRMFEINIILAYCTAFLLNSDCEAKC